MSENTTASTSPGVPVEDPTPFGWLTTADHKRTGRLFHYQLARIPHHGSRS